MTHVMFRCPLTRQPVDTGMTLAEYATVEDTQAMGHPFTCSSCGLVHTWYKAETWIGSPPAQA